MDKSVFTHTGNNDSGLRCTVTMCDSEFRMVAEPWVTMREITGPEESQLTMKERRRRQRIGRNGR
eukprot:5140106-Amphidinium_carterae.1